MPQKKVSGSLAQVYAAALYDVAVETNQLERVADELAGLDAVLRKDARLAVFLESPTVRFEDKRRVLDQALASFSVPMRNYLLVAVRKRRVDMLGQIAEAFHEYANVKAGIAEVRLASARSLEAPERAKLQAALETGLKKKVVFQESVKPALLGGFVLTYGDRQWDTSLTNRLKRLSVKMEEARDALGVWAKE